MALPDDIRRELRIIFSEEAGEATVEMNRVLLDAAEAKGQRPVELDSLKRWAHTLKGASTAMEAPELRRLFHGFEDFLAGLSREQTPDEGSLDTALRFVAALREDIRPSVAADDEPGMAAAIERTWRLLKKDAAPEPATAPKAAPGKEQGGAGGVEAVRVSAAALDAMLRQSEEMAAFSTWQRSRVGALRQVGQRVESLSRLLKREGRGNVDDAVERGLGEIQQGLSALAQESERSTEISERVSNQIRSELRRLRLQPMELLHESIRLVVRDAAQQTGKQVQLQIEGADVRLDRRILDGIRDPLLHLVRNAVAHGIEAPQARLAAGKPESGRLHVGARTIGSRVVITVTDDGRGIDPAAIGQRAAALGLWPKDAPAPSMSDAIGLMFASGLSTSAIDEVSGRGVGLDVVRQNVAGLGGQIEVESTPGIGASFAVNLPLTLASMRGLLARVGGQTVAFPNHAFERLAFVTPENPTLAGGQATFMTPEGPLAYVALSDVIEEVSAARARHALILKVAERRLAVGVDSVLAEEEMIVAALPPAFRQHPLFAGAVVRPTGDVYLVVDPAALAGVQARPQAAPRPKAQTARVLVVDDSVTTRSMHRHVLEAEGYAVTTAANGEEAFALISQAPEPFALVVSDVHMPRLDGIGLAKRLRATEQFRRLPLILISSLGSEEDRRRGIESGANAYIEKREYDSGMLVQMVRRLA